MQRVCFTDSYIHALGVQSNSVVKARQMMVLI